VDLLPSGQMNSGTASASTTEKLFTTNAGLTAADDGVFETAQTASHGDLKFTDTLILTVFSVVYETVVVLLRIRSSLAASFPR
jgi:hypothetical protein